MVLILGGTACLIFPLSCILTVTILFYATRGSNALLESIPELNFFDSDDLSSFMKEQGGVKPFHITYPLGKNSGGTCLYVSRDSDRKTTMYVLDLSAKTVTTLVKSADNAFLGEDLNFSAWIDYSNQLIHFPCGTTLPRLGTPRFEPSGEYFYYCSEIRHVKTPDKILARTGIYYDFMFVRQNYLYIFERIRSSSFFEKSSLKYESYKISEEGLILEKQGHITGFHGSRPHIEDMDQSGEYLILYPEADAPFTVFQRWYLYNMKEETMTPGARLGKKRMQALFLSEKYFQG